MNLKQLAGSRRPITQVKAIIFLSYVVLLAGLATIGFTIFTVVSSYSPVLFWDHWDIIRELAQHHDHVTLRELFAQHNEHRLPVGRLLFYADLFAFGGRNISLLAEIVVSQALLLTVLVWTLVRSRLFGSAASILAAGVLAYCLFSPLQITNFVWPFQVTFVLAALSSIVSFAAALQYSLTPDAKHGSRIWLLVVCVLSGLVAEGSLATGILTWPLLSLLAFTLRLSRRDQVILGAVGIVAIAAYFIHYHSPPSPPADLHVSGILKFVLTEVAWSVDPNVPNPSMWPMLSEAITFVALGMGVAAATRILIFRRRATPFACFTAVSFLYALSAVVLTAIGRLRYGLPQATESRYQSLALLFWATLFLLGIAAARRNGRALLRLQVAILIFLTCGCSRFVHMYAWAKGRQDGLSRGWAALISGSSTDPAANVLYFDPNTLHVLASYLVQHKWGPALPQDTRILMIIPREDGGAVNGYRLQPSDRCSGFIDVVNGPSKDSNVLLSGWAWNNASGSIPAEIALTSKTGTIVAYADTGLPRPDVQKAAPQVKSGNSGWRVSISRQLASGTYDVFALDEKNKLACALSNELFVQDGKQTSR